MTEINCMVCGYQGEPIWAITEDWLRLPRCPVCGAMGSDLEVIPPVVVSF